MSCPWKNRLFFSTLNGDIAYRIECAHIFRFRNKNSTVSVNIFYKTLNHFNRQSYHRLALSLIQRSRDENGMLLANDFLD